MPYNDTVPTATMKVKADATIGSQISRAKTLMEKGKLGKQFEIKGISSKAGTIAIIVGRNLGIITNLKVEPYTTPQGHRSLQVAVSVDTENRSNVEELHGDYAWNVCVPDPERGQSISSSCRALDGKLQDLGIGESIVIRGAGQALNVMVVFYSHVQTEWPGCEITKTRIKNNVIENRETGRKNKKTLMSFTVKRNEWEEEEEEGYEEDGSEDGSEDDSGPPSLESVSDSDNEASRDCEEQQQD